MAENEYRATYCPGFGDAYCECPFTNNECPGYWDCEEIEYIVVNTMTAYDSNEDNVINPEDDDEYGHYELM
jgi:hypothetical protein